MRVSRAIRRWGPFGVSFVAMVVSIYFSLLSRNNYYQLLPLQEADVVFSGNDMHITPDSYLVGASQIGDTIDAAISNIGHSAAAKIHFRIFVAPFNFPQVSKIFDDYLVGDLQPGEKTTFGVFGVNYKLDNGIDATILKGHQQLGLLFHLSYVDSLTNNQKDEVFFYQYVLGTSSSLADLTNGDYSKLYEQLLDKVSSSSDPYLYKYLRKRLPSSFN